MVLTYSTRLKLAALHPRPPIRPSDCPPVYLYFVRIIITFAAQN